MIKRLNENAQSYANCCGGEGEARIDNLFDAKDLYANPSWVGMVNLGKDDTVGYHQHNGDMELYTIVKGTALFNDNGTEAILYPGDTTLTKDGEFHSIKPYECDELSFLAAVITL